MRSDFGCILHSRSDITDAVLKFANLTRCPGMVLFSSNGKAHPKQFLEDLELLVAIDEKSKKKIILFIEHMITVDMGASLKVTQKARHMVQPYHYVREGIERNQHALIWITRNAQVAYLVTKTLSRILLDSVKELAFAEVPEQIRNKQNLGSLTCMVLMSSSSRLRPLTRALSRSGKLGELLSYAHSSGIY
jgi:hypothetical protein